jgi:hypothetical protein
MRLHRDTLVRLVLPFRYALKLFAARRERAQYADRVLRESATLRAAEEIWSDVASSRGLGFRSSEAGPLLYGDLESGAALEIVVLETADDGSYRTVAKARGEGAAAGRVLVRPHGAMTRLAERVLAPPAGLAAGWSERFFVRAKPPELARARLSEKILDVMVELEDRAPHLYWDDGEAMIVLEGVELVHARIDAVVTALSELTRRGA